MVARPLHPTRVAVMQPYFFPYADYFWLFATVDKSIIFDSVQFARRGRIHRSEVPVPGGATEWLTLPLAYHPRDVLIRDLVFASDARERFDKRLARLSWIDSVAGPQAAGSCAFLRGPMGLVIDYLEASLRPLLKYWIWMS